MICLADKISLKLGRSKFIIFLFLSPMKLVHVRQCRIFTQKLLEGSYFGLFQKGPVFQISAMVATISRAYSRFFETKYRSILLRKYGPEKSLTRSGRGMMPSAVPGSNLAQFLTCSSDRKRFMLLQAPGMSWNHFQKGTAT